MEEVAVAVEELEGRDGVSEGADGVEAGEEVDVDGLGVAGAEVDGVGRVDALAAAVELVGVVDAGDVLAREQAGVAQDAGERADGVGAAREAEEQDGVAGLVVEGQEEVELADVEVEALAKVEAGLAVEAVALRADARVVEDELLLAGGADVLDGAREGGDVRRGALVEAAGGQGACAGRGRGGAGRGAVACLRGARAVREDAELLRHGCGGARGRAARRWSATGVRKRGGAARGKRVYVARHRARTDVPVRKDGKGREALVLSLPTGAHAEIVSGARARRLATRWPVGAAVSRQGSAGHVARARRIGVNLGAQDLTCANRVSPRALPAEPACRKALRQYRCRAPSLRYLGPSFPHCLIPAACSPGATACVRIPLMFITCGGVGTVTGCETSGNGRRK